MLISVAHLIDKIGYFVLIVFIDYFLKMFLIKIKTTQKMFVPSTEF